MDLNPTLVTLEDLHELKTAFNPSPIITERRQKDLPVMNRFGMRIRIENPRGTIRKGDGSLAPQTGIRFESDWDPEKHPRGKPGNAGQFRKKTESEVRSAGRKAKKVDLPPEGMTVEETLSPSQKRELNKLKKNRDALKKKLNDRNFFKKVRMDRDIQALAGPAETQSKGKKHRRKDIPEDPPGTRYFDRKQGVWMQKVDPDNPSPQAIQVAKWQREGKLSKTFTPSSANIYIAEDLSKGRAASFIAATGKHAGELVKVATPEVNKNFRELKHSENGDVAKAIQTFEKRKKAIVGGALRGNGNDLATLLVMTTGLRVGSKGEGPGVRNLTPENFSHNDDGDLVIEQRGKSGILNRRVITDDADYDIEAVKDRSRVAYDKVMAGRSLTAKERRILEEDAETLEMIALDNIVYDPEAKRALEKRIKKTKPGESVFSDVPYNTTQKRGIGILDHMRDHARQAGVESDTMAAHDFRRAHGARTFEALVKNRVALEGPPRNIREYMMLMQGNVGATKKGKSYPQVRSPEGLATVRPVPKASATQSRVARATPKPISGIPRSKPGPGAKGRSWGAMFLGAYAINDEMGAFEAYVSPETAKPLKERLGYEWGDKVIPSVAEIKKILAKEEPDGPPTPRKKTKRRRRRR